MTAKNVWMNYVSEAMIHSVMGKAKPFKNVSFDCAASASGIATVSVNEGQVTPSTKKDKTVVAGYFNVLLGSEGTKRQVSITNADGTYGRIEMGVEEILESFTTGREEFRATKAAEAPVIEPEA